MLENQIRQKNMIGRFGTTFPPHDYQKQEVVASAFLWPNSIWKREFESKRISKHSKCRTMVTYHAMVRCCTAVQVCSGSSWTFPI